MKNRTLFCALVGLAGIASASAQSVYVFRTGNAAHDQLVVDSLNAEGLTATLGDPVSAFNNLSIISDFDAVYLQANFNYGFTWSASQESVMMNYVASGGGLITAEWVVWMAAVNPAYFPTMRNLFPVVPNSNWDSRGSVVYTRATADGVLNDGVPNTFTTNTTSIAGVYTYFNALRPGATSFYSEAGRSLVAGWDYSNGRVIMFNTVNGQLQLQNLNFRRLLGNAFKWVTATPLSGPGVRFTPSLNNLSGGFYSPNFALSWRNASNNVSAGRSGAAGLNLQQLIGPGPAVPGSYTVRIKPTYHLSRLRTVTTVANQNVNLGTISFIAGDANGDNEIGAADFSLLAAAYDRVDGEPQYRIGSDFNGDGEVGAADFSILAANYDAVGE